jgi:hypothetical protein
MTQSSEVYSIVSGRVGMKHAPNGTIRIVYKTSVFTDMNLRIQLTYKLSGPGGDGKITDFGNSPGKIPEG